MPVAIESSSAKVSTRQSVRRSKSKVMSLGKRMPRTALIDCGSEEYAGCATAERNEKTLSEQLPDESLPACADREPHRNFPSTLRRARKQQVGKIHAGEQKHERTDGREDTGESEDGILDVGNEQAGFPEPNAEADVLRIILREFCGERLKRSLRLRERHAGLQASYGEKIVRIAPVEPRAPGLDRLRHHHRDKHLRIVGDLSANKSFRRHADNSERPAVELQPSSPRSAGLPPKRCCQQL